MAFKKSKTDKEKHILASAISRIDVHLKKHIVMKNKFIPALALILSITLFAFYSNREPLAIGSDIPQEKLIRKDFSGKEFSLDKIKTKKGLLVIFSCNTCPYVKYYETRIKDIQDKCKSMGIGAVIINSNEAYRGEEDSPEAMKKYAEAQNYSAPYLMDEKSTLADAFGATRTPECFLFDANGKLIYKGAIDDNVKDEKAVSQHYLKEAITAVSNGKKPEVSETKSIGCSIKRAE